MSNDEFHLTSDISLLGAFSVMAYLPTTSFKGEVIDLLKDQPLINEVKKINWKNRLLSQPAPYPTTASYLESLFSPQHEISPLGIAFNGAIISVKTPNDIKDRMPVLTDQDDFGKFDREYNIQTGHFIGYIPKALAEYHDLTVGEAVKANIGLSFQSEHPTDYKPIVTKIHALTR